MDESDWLIERFEASRPRLRAVAYRMLGSYTEADDAVQDAWLRLDRADPSGVENLARWFTSIVARVCLDRLRWRRSRREDPVDAHPSEPMVGVADETTPSTKRSWPTPSVPRCWWCWTCWLPPNGSRSSFTRSIGGAAATQLALLDGAVGRVWGGSPRMVFDFTITDEKIVAIDLVADPDRLRHIDIVVLDH